MIQPEQCTLRASLPQRPMWPDTPPPLQQKKTYFFAIWNSYCSIQCLLHGMWVNGAQFRLSVVNKQKRCFDKENFNLEKPTDMKSENSISLTQSPTGSQLWKLTWQWWHKQGLGKSVTTIWKEASWPYCLQQNMSYDKHALMTCDACLAATHCLL